MSLKKAFLFLAAAAYLAALGAVVYGTIVGLRQFAGWRRGRTEPGPPSGRPEIRGGGGGLKKKFDALAPKGVYIVIDTGANRFYLKKGTEIVRAGPRFDRQRGHPAGPEGEAPVDLRHAARGVRRQVQGREPLLGQAGLGVHRGGRAHPEERRRTGRRRGARRLCPGIRQRIFPSRYALYPAPGQERHPRLRPDRRRGPEIPFQVLARRDEDLYLLR